MLEEYGLSPLLQCAGDVAIFATYVHVAKNVVGNVPDEVGEAVELRLIHVRAFCSRAAKAFVAKFKV